MSGYSKVWVLKIIGPQGLSVLKKCGYSNLHCGHSKFVDTQNVLVLKSYGTQNLWVLKNYML